MRIIKKLSLSISIILILSIVLPMFSVDSIKNVEAANRLQGVQKIVTSMSQDDKYTILEIVPDESFASIGYYVSGYETELSEKIIASTLKTEVTGEIGETSITGYEERNNIATNSFSALKDSVVQYSVDSLYQEAIQYSEAVENWNVITAPTGKTFKDIRKGTYDQIDEESTDVGDYSYDGSVYTYTPGQGTYVWEDDYQDGTLQVVEFGALYYKTTVTSNDWFAKRVLEIGAAVGTENAGPVTNHNIEVITVTPNDLEERLNVTTEGALQLVDIDMIYLSNSSCLALPTVGVEYATYDSNTSYTEEKENDISWETAYNIFEYVVNTNLPIIVDDSIVPAITLDEASAVISANNNIVRLAYLLKNYTEEYENGLKYTIDQYKLSDDDTYVIPSVLPGKEVEEGEETREQADTKIGRALGQSFANYITFETKLAGKKAAIYASVFINKSGKNLVHSAFSTDQETIVVDSSTTSSIYGVQSVVDEIHTENFYYHLDSKEFTTEYVYDSANPSVKVNQPTLIKYILNFQNRRIELYKDKITVLDIEPTKYSTLTEDTVRSWITGTLASQKIKEIEIIQTSTYEFIGKLDDLNKEYDLIYFGSCIGTSNLHGSMNQTSAGVPDYNDSNLDGYIYSHVGDKVKIEYRAGGLLNDELTVSGGKQQLNKTSIETRYSGNDITDTKVQQLKEYVEAGYPVVISSKFYAGNVIDTNSVDANSSMYEFMSSCVNKQNVLKESEGLENVLADYINMPKLNLSLISQPDEYAITEQNGKISAVNYLQKLGNRNVLIYSFEITNTSEGNLNANDYQVQLFIDINADGQFDESEELDALEVMKTSNLEAVEVDKLKQNVRYTVSRELPEDYVGIIPWQLKVSMVEYDSQDPTKKVESSVRTTAEGFTAIETTQTTVVKVLQIASTQMNNGTKYTGLILPYKNLLGNDLSSSKIYTTKFNTLFEDLKEHMGFDIQVDVISVDDYVEEYNKYANVEDPVNAFYKAFYKDYDMIIMGFEDCYEDIASAGAVQAIDMFIKSGRSVLFSHDTTSYFNVERNMYNLSNESSGSGRPWYHWGYHLNQYIRSDVGMDRYGITETDLSILKGAQNLAKGTTEETIKAWDSYIKKASDLDKEVAYYSDSNDKGSDNKDYTAHEVHGFSNGLIETYFVSSTGSSNYRSGVLNKNDFVANNNSNGHSYYSKSITQVNQGQITTYPYDINLESEDELRTNVTSGSKTFKSMNLPAMEIAQTHAQYYQLDMNIDKDSDGSADMVVWYCLSNNRNAAFPNDVRNNYYIYSVGNVTYTGMGHYQDSITGTGLSEYEAKLFVNTIMASLSSGKKNPSVNIVANETNKGSSLNYIYRTYDQGTIMDDASDVVLNFYATDMNIVNGTKTILAKYYYEIPSSEYKKQQTDVEITNSDGTKKYLRVIPTTYISGLEIVDNGKIVQVSIDGEWINGEMQKATTDSPFMLYVGAQTMMNSSLNANEVEYTAEVYDSVTFKQRNLFNLD